MFDFNAIVNAAIAEAVNARITEVLAQHANIVGGLTERITTLETNEQYLTQRITTLENNPAQGVDTTVLTATAFATELRQIKERVITLESRSDDECLTRGDVESLITQAVEEAMDDHTSTYDHDEYDNASSVINDTDFDDFVKKGDGDLEEVVRDTIRNMTFEAR